MYIISQLFSRIIVIRTIMMMHKSSNEEIG